MTIRRHHDMGGLPADPVQETEHEYEVWEKRVDAIIKLLSRPQTALMSSDLMRRGIEDLGPDVYDNLSYYERWITSTTNILLEKGVITVDELGRKMAEVEERWLADREAAE